MQITPVLDIATLGIAGIFMGLLFGYAIGGMSSLGFSYRAGLGVIISVFGGMITGLVALTLAPTTPFLPSEITSFDLLLLVMSFLGGYILGATANWAVLPDSEVKRHVIFEPDDDDEFDREIEEAMGGDFKANNS
ncbi:MAG: hypothetical protein ACFFE2_16245 [Candidatus Thorarchaeota archaeon]